jgi:hypothetical protein
MQNKKAYECSHHGHTGITRHSPRDGFTAYNVLFPVIGLCCHRHRRDTSRQLDASVEASEPHDFAVRITRCSSTSTSASIASRPAFMTIASAPQVRRDGAGYGFDLGETRRNIFLQSGLDTLGDRFARQANGKA